MVSRVLILEMSNKIEQAVFASQQSGTQKSISTVLRQQQKISSNLSGPLPVEMLLHHFGDGARHGPLLRRQALVEARAQPLLQEVDDEFSATHLLLVVFDPRHLSLR